MSLSLLSAILIGGRTQRCHSSQYWSNQKMKNCSSSCSLVVTLKWFNNHRVKRQMMMMMSKVANLHLWIWIEDSLKCFKRNPPIETMALTDEKVNQLKKTNLTLSHHINLASKSPQRMQRSSMKMMSTKTTTPAKFSTWETKRCKQLVYAAQNEYPLTCTLKLSGKRKIIAPKKHHLPIIIK